MKAKRGSIAYAVGKGAGRIKKSKGRKSHSTKRKGASGFYQMKSSDREVDGYKKNLRRMARGGF